MAIEVTGSLIRIKGEEFAIIKVESRVLEEEERAKDYLRKHSFIFPGFPILLVAYDEQKNPTYYGKKEIIHLLDNIKPEQIPWKRYVIHK